MGQKFSVHQKFRHITVLPANGQKVASNYEEIQACFPKAGKKLPPM